MCRSKLLLGFYVVLVGVGAPKNLWLMSGLDFMMN
jgi:hypothetical protein